MAMRQERLYNTQDDGGLTFLGGSHQLVIDDTQFTQGAEADPAATEGGPDSSELLSDDATDLLGGLEQGGSGIDEFFYRGSQTYEEVQEVKRFFSVDAVKRAAAPEAGQSRLRMDQLLDHAVQVFSPLYEYRKSYVPYVPQRPIRVVQFRATQNPDLCDRRYSVEGGNVGTNYGKYLPQCNLQY